ncbi:hypothetical protein ACPCSC_06730 [Streptomyces lavendulocolor]|uniref:hypothetical protein n=1 Tax=Streptomyces lavendulocolor TaxID=67316 RepID=UPI003C2D28B4
MMEISAHLPYMASIVERPKEGRHAYQVKWRQAGHWQTENFGDRDSADSFKGLVEAHGGNWPHGWVRGEGFVQAERKDGDMPFKVWAERYIDSRTGIDDATRDRYRRELHRHLALIQHTDQYGQVHPATIGTRATRRRGCDARHTPSRSRTGTASCTRSSGPAAIEATPPLRTVNCCSRTLLPRVDVGIEAEMTFLERDEYQRVVQELPVQGSRDVVDRSVARRGCRVTLSSGTPSA